MGWNKTLFCIILFLAQAFYCIAQTNTYFFEFKDKKQSQKPTHFLSNKANKRRVNQKITISFSDFPVDNQYIQKVLAFENTTYNYSLKWLNGILVDCDEFTALEISSLPFVVSSKLVKTKNIASNQNRSLLQVNKLSTLAYGNSEDQIKSIGVDKMHECGITGRGILIAVFDGGFSGADNAASLRHLFSQNRIKYTYNIVENSTNVFTKHAHGTNVLSCIAANMPGNIIGTGYGADFALIISEDVASETLLEEYNWMKAAEIADSIGADIISSSLGYNTFDNSLDDHKLNELDGKTTVITKAALIAARKGILVLNSAGNNYNDKKWPYIIFPSDADSILSVGATQIDKTKASFSAIGPTFDKRIKPDVAALGVAITLNNSGSTITNGNGTSYSAPLIAGLAAGIWEYDSTLTNIELLYTIKKSSSQYLTPNNEIGYGIPNYTAAIQLINKEIKANCDTYINRISEIFPNPIQDYIVISLDKNQDIYNSKIKFLELNGKVVMEMDLMELNFKENRIEIKNLKTGAYILMVGSKMYKIIKL